MTQPNFVIEAAVDAVQTVAAAIDVVRTSSPVNCDVSAAVHTATMAIIAAAPLLIVDGDPHPDAVALLLASVPKFPGVYTDGKAILGASVISTIRALGDGMDPNVAQQAMLDLASAFTVTLPTTFLSPNEQTAALNAAAVNNMARRAALIAWSEALVSQTYTDRPHGVTARAEAAERIELELNHAAGAPDYALYVALQNLRGAVVAYLTRLIADLAPVVTVEAARALPSLWWSWRLYQDPARAVDLVLRNTVPHPSLMPQSFSALSPGYVASTSLPTAWPAA